mmetsp:Transcript_40302/g.97317  ORF Transcript_40302/g.97317 Transcript_40302/m.97317 type:complete len:218 (-) Transcript_40302:69-722(-)
MSSALDVGVDVDVRILDGWSHSCSGSHVANPFWSLLLEEVKHELFVADVTLVNGKASLIRVKRSEVVKIGLLDVDVVVVIHLINNNDVISAGKEKFGDVATDETSSSCDQNLLVPNVRGNGGFGFLSKVSEAEGAYGTVHIVMISVRFIARFIARSGSISAVIVTRTEHRHTVCMLEIFHFGLVQITSCSIKGNGTLVPPFTRDCLKLACGNVVAMI